MQMSFPEFLEARGRGTLASWLAFWRVGDDVPDDLHAGLMWRIGDYTIVGGLPKSVDAFCARAGDWTSACGFDMACLAGSVIGS